ncbi:MAG: hypothetical protein QXI89_00990 [Candidatus Anstonellales archaeon]
MKENKAYDSYYSISYWLNPKLLGKREKEKEYDTVFLKSDIFFDIDVSKGSLIENIDIARERALQLYDYLIQHDYKINYIAFSGSKGFHISCLDEQEFKEQNPRKREEAVLNNRKELYKEFERFNIDKGVFIDTRRIVRLPFTYNFKSGYMCVPLRPYELEIKAKDLLKYIPKMKLPAKSSIAMTLLRNMPRKTGQEGSAGLPSGTYFVHALSSQIAGKGKHILIMQQGTKLQRIKNILKKHGISMYSIFNVNGKIYIASPIIIDKSKAEKIMRITKSPSLNAFIKYGHSLLPIGFIYDEHFNKITETKVVFKEEGACKYHVSETHAKLLGFNKMPDSNKPVIRIMRFVI